jgi:SAM-dependent methyltransferase
VGIDEQIDRVATAWEQEYDRGRYLDEPPLPFVDDILRAVADEGFKGCQGVYIGCGNGRNFAPLCECGLDLIGLDVSSVGIAQLAARMPDRRDRMVVGTIDDLDAGLTFALVVGIQVFQHGTRGQTHALIEAAQARTRPGGLFCLRVNAVGTDVWPDHERVEQHADGGFSVRYTSGPKSGLNVHFFARLELEQLFATDFEPVLPLRVDKNQRLAPQPGQWQQWEAIWRRKALTTC